MKFGMRECCDVVFKAKYPMQIGKKIFYKGEPVIYFDTLKTSTLEGAATTVYAQGGRGNARLIAWEGDRTLTFTMEDALISQMGIAILTGAGLIEADAENQKPVHSTYTSVVSVAENKIIIADVGEPIALKTKSGADLGCYVMLFDDNGNLACEPFSSLSAKAEITVTEGATSLEIDTQNAELLGTQYTAVVDFYTMKGDGLTQIEITADKFAGNFYIEGSTLYRATSGQDLPAELIIPNGKVQSNFTFTMAGSGDPSTFTFTIDAFPDMVIGESKKTLATIQVFEPSATGDDGKRDQTNSLKEVKEDGSVDLKVEKTEGAEGTEAAG